MTPRLLTTQEAADRLGLTPGSLQKLRWLDDGLPIFQQGLDVHYRLEDLEAFEQREVRTLLKQVLQYERPLPLIRSIARSLDLAVNTQGVESDPAVFKPSVREDLKPAPKVKASTPVLAQQDAPKAAAAVVLFEEALDLRRKCDRAFVVADQQDGADVLRHGSQAVQQRLLGGQVEALFQGDWRGRGGQPMDQRRQRLARINRSYCAGRFRVDQRWRTRVIHPR